MFAPADAHHLLRPALFAALLLLGTAVHAASAPRPRSITPGWNFAVSGDSRNCGDVVMPSIAAGARADHAAFYWHLGDLRAIYDFDEDYRAVHPKTTILEYESTAWLDFEQSQIAAFGDMPFFIGMGNHETIPPKTRNDFVTTFADWLDTPVIRDRRLADDPQDHAVRAYYHWRWEEIDFITLDNATPDQFDAAQLAWLKKLAQSDANDPTLRAVVVGMHEALPESLARGHSMSDSAGAAASGLLAYQLLLELHDKKPVYVLASHSHFVMQGIYDTPYWREHGGVLPGWIIGTAGAVRYPLPAEASRSPLARTHVYGYLLATVSPPGTRTQDPIHFEFKEVTRADIPAAVEQRFAPELLRYCYEDNARN